MGFRQALQGGAEQRLEERSNFYNTVFLQHGLNRLNDTRG